MCQSISIINQPQMSIYIDSGGKEKSSNPTEYQFLEKNPF